MPRSSDAPGPARPATTDRAQPASAQERRLARDLFLLGLKQTLGRSAGPAGGELQEPFVTLLARALAGMPPGPRQAAPVAAGVSHGR